MDPLFKELSDNINGFELNHETNLPSSDQYPDPTNGFKFVDDSHQYPNVINGFDFVHDSDQYPNLTNGFKFEADSPDLNFADLPFLGSDLGSGNSALPPSSDSPAVSSPSDDGEDPLLKYISQVLLEEDLEGKSCMFRDSLALQAAEKSFSEALGEKFPPSPNQVPFLDSPDGTFSSNFSDNSSHGSTSMGTGSSVDPQFFADLQSQLPFNYFSQSNLESGSHSLNNSSDGFSTNYNVLGDPSLETLLVSNIFSDKESVMQFNRGVEEASKFLPSNSNLLIDLESYTSAPAREEVATEVVVKAEKGGEKENSLNGSRGRKRDEIELEDGMRSNKQSAVYVEETDELSEMFDKVLLSTHGEKMECCLGSVNEVLQNGAKACLEQNEQSQGSNGGKARGKKQGNRKEEVDLRSLLILCAQAVSSNDVRTATELLKQIRQHSSPTGDGSQRLAHYFADGLEARLAGTGTQRYTALGSKKTSAADMLKAYQVYFQCCPFKKLSILFAINRIMNAAENAKTLHLIDFGISYGFPWPLMIQHISARPGGPPKLRVTGIELPQPGFRPAERVEETGRRLKKYCERFNVPFEYNAIAQKWETIQIEDLKLENDEVRAVNTLFRFKNLLDETVVDSSPRNTVLNLIRKIKPAVFVQAVVNGSYNAPFFVTRFREALFHFSALFDMFEDNLPSDNQERLMYEKEFLGREAMNVIACEGSERVERPESYKQWQVRNTRAGFRQMPIEEKIMNKFRGKLKAWYNKDFVLDQDGGWMLLGWKGRIVYASSCWVPA
ncbi:hypothetical protein L1049_013853 [Liquidambar formosana]|uniref:Scarecrow-like protein 14 n=1 Tax=Liquidambar formosana TaxID=63359 RepID=A0AAP0WX66_LIQFO